LLHADWEFALCAARGQRIVSCIISIINILGNLQQCGQVCNSFNICFPWVPRWQELFHYEANGGCPRYAISKKYFRLVGMVPLEWTCCVRTVRDTAGADYSVPGVDSMHRVSYRRPITVLPFLLVLLVFYLKQSLRCCGQLRPYVGMGSLGPRLNRNCNAMGDTAKISPCMSSTGVQKTLPSSLILRDCKAMGDVVKISPRVPSTCVQNAILSLLIIHIIPSR
jgi:hypothetical protein